MRAPRRWSGDPAAVAAVLAATGRPIEVVCPAGHALARVWATPRGDVCASRPTFDVGANYEALFTDDPAPELHGQLARDTLTAEARFVADIADDFEVWCRCRRAPLSREWLVEQVAALRNRTRRADRQVVLT